MEILEWLSAGAYTVAAAEFSLEAIAQGCAGLCSPVESRGEAPIGGLRDEIEAVCRHCLQILTVETIKIWKFRTIRLLILDQYVSSWGLSDIFVLAHDWWRH